MADTRACSFLTLFLTGILLGLVVVTNGFHFKRDKPNGGDTQGGRLRFNVEERGPVGMFVHNSTSYDPTTPEGLEAYEHLLPSGGHVVYISDATASKQNERPELAVYTVALFHRLKCLEIISKQYVNYQQELSPTLTHCMNYLRQSILCRLNLHLESVRNPQGYIEEVGYDAKCNDWSAVYEEAERNHMEYLQLLGNN